MKSESDLKKGPPVESENDSKKAPPMESESDLKKGPPMESEREGEKVSVLWISESVRLKDLARNH